MPFDAFHIPGLDQHSITEWNALPADVRAPRLTPHDVRRISTALRAAGETLRARTVDQIVHAVDAAARLMVENEDVRGELIAMTARATGYSHEMTAHVVDHMVSDWQAPALRLLLTSEFSDPRVLDGFHQSPDSPRMVHARGAGLALHIFAGNVPGVTVTSLIRSLLVKSPVLAKTASGEPILPVLFARALDRVDPAMARAVAVTYWPGGQADVEGAALAEVDQVVHYGGREAIESVRSRLPSHVRLVEHGPRLSFGIVGRAALASADHAATIARDIAYATAVFDQQGCVSPHTVFVEHGASVSPEELTGLIDEALTALGVELPPATLAPGEAAAIRQVRTDAEFRAIAGEKVLVKGPDMLAHTVIYDPVPALTPSCLNRTLKVCGVGSVRDIVELVEPFGGLLQSVAIEGVEEMLLPLSQSLALAGVTRITTFRQLPWPSPGWRHDGRGPLSELVYWTELAR